MSVGSRGVGFRRRIDCGMVLISLICVATTAEAVDCYVARTGSDWDAGTDSEPFRTVAKGVGIAAPGDTIILKDGTYGNEGHISDGGGCWHGCASAVKINTAGTSSAWITIKAENKWGAI